MANWATHRLVMLVELVVFVVALSPTPSAADTPVSFGEALQDLGDRLEKAPRFKHLQKSVLDEVLHARQPLTGGESVYGFLRKAWGAERLNRSAVGQPCVEDVNKILAALILSQEEWALRMVDAAGKIGSGILDGNIGWVGSYDECLDVTATKANQNNVTEVMFTGQYCVTTIGLSASSRGGGAFGMPADLGVQLGICVPSTCSKADVHNLIQGAFAFLPNSTRVLSTKCKPESIPFDTPAIVILCLLLALVVLLFVATLYDVVVYRPFMEGGQERVLATETDREITNGSLPTESSQGVLRADEFTPLLNSNPKGKTKGILDEPKQITIFGEILVKFSLYTNGGKLLSTVQTSNSVLGCVHGIRFISMTWVILGHSILFAVIELRNLLQFPKYIQRWSFQGIMNATVSVDTFFLISGLLLAYLVLREIKELGGPRKINWLLFYFHRFWRLTPAYMLVLGTYTALFKYFGNGPFWPDGDMEKSCRTTWWKNLLYINNLVKPSDSCMAWSWYLANDMQFFIISPLILIPLYLHFAAGFAVILVLLLASFMSTGIISVLNGYPASTPAFFNSPTKFVSYFQHLYIVPWTRIGPYLVGILIGYVLYRTDRKVKLSKFVVMLGWAVAIASSLAVLYGLCDLPSGKVLTPEVTAFYNTVHRTVWAAGVGWVIFACVTGYGGPVNALLCWPALIPLSRLTFIAYLIHPLVIERYYLSQRITLYYTNTTTTYLFLGHLMVTYGVAFVLSLAFEAPMIALEKLIFKRR